MVIDVELINLILYCVQQLGVALGLGAQTIMLVAFVHATRDGKIDDTEAQFLRATRITLWVSLMLIIASGIVISLFHFLGTGSPDAAVASYNINALHSPAFLFKWAVIVAIVALSALIHMLPETFAEALLGANWYALFLVHILAPVTTWTNLLTLWGVWVAGFCVCWYAAVFMSRHANGKIMQPRPLFTLFKKTPSPTEAREVAKPLVVSKIQKTEEPKRELPKIILDNVPNEPPMVMPKHIGTPTEVIIPVFSAKPLPKPATTPIVAKASFQPPVSPVKAPAAITTDTPFLPQVPPLQPIPIKPPDQAANGIVQTAGLAPGVPHKEAPSLQKPEDLTANAEAPKVPLGLTVMPKNPDQLPK